MFLCYTLFIRKTFCSFKTPESLLQLEFALNALSFCVFEPQTFTCNSYFKIHFGTDLHSLQELIVTSIIAFRVIRSILFVDILYLHSFQIKPMPIFLLQVFEDNTPIFLPFFKPEQTYC